MQLQLQVKHVGKQGTDSAVLFVAPHAVQLHLPLRGRKDFEAVSALVSEPLDLFGQ